MNVEIGQFFAPCNPLLNAGQWPKEADQFRRAFDDEFGGWGPRSHQREVADELDGIAQALLGMEKDRAIAEVFTVPPGLSEISSPAGKVLPFPSPFQLAPA